MGIWDIAIFVISLMIMIVGMAGIVVPIIPSTPLIWVGAFIYALCTHFEKVTWVMLLLFALMAIFFCCIGKPWECIRCKKIWRYTMGNYWFTGGYRRRVLCGWSSRFDFRTYRWHHCL
ncbi:MAG: hypothetical protein AYP45_06905 [Candidatus Brocadia carolinensis]|uniref:DUF456 domain-containing protein n=1 Tax=Candidatus Brocadia carolinensis TaxID=1004156 RepID=A0A1V4AUK9_9BACT|nr:MAG: hypothetical protein AYP45_06905 [Candidatus Brocadia caroliniensis]